MTTEKELKNTQWTALLKLLKREVVPALGCTEPAAVALAVAKASELLGTRPEKIDVWLSAGVLKNAMGVGIPGTGMSGLPIAIAMGSLTGKSENGLEVLRDVSPDTLKEGKELAASGAISIHLKDPAPDDLYIEAVCSKGAHTAKAVIACEHQRIVFTGLNGQVLSSDPVLTECREEKKVALTTLSFHTICDFAFHAPVDDLRFILQAARLNRLAAEESRKGSFGHSVGETIRKASWAGMQGSILANVVGQTAAACDVRMAGAQIPVMSNSGSGNQGIAATLPVVVFAEENGKTEEEQIRALIVSHLVTIYIKQYLGRLSALCGAMVAAIGSGCAITWLMGGNERNMADSAINMIGNLTGMICDGAKPSCALKVSGAVSMAMLSAELAMHNKVVTPVEGIVADDVDQTIRNLASIGSKGMQETNKMILDIMIEKQNTHTN